MLDEIYQSLDPVAFTIGSFSIRWYGIGYSVSFLLAAILAMRICKRWEIKFSFESLLTLLIACMIGTLVGGRLGYVIFYSNGYYFEHPAEIFAFTQGGMAGMSFHGGLIGFAAGLIIAAKITHMPIMTLGDIAGICTPIGLGIVRIANFINGELWGATTTMPWGVVFNDAGPLPRHPTQLYEAFLEGIVLLVLLFIMSRRKPPLPRGSHFGVFLIGYGIFRIAIEFIRVPDRQLGDQGYLFGTDWITMGMTLSLPMVLLGILFIAYAIRFKLPQMGQEALVSDDTALIDIASTEDESVNGALIEAEEGDSNEATVLTFDETEPQTLSKATQRGSTKTADEIESASESSSKPSKEPAPKTSSKPDAKDDDNVSIKAKTKTASKSSSKPSEGTESKSSSTPSEGAESKSSGKLPKEPAPKASPKASTETSSKGAIEPAEGSIDSME